mgnify:CR=1 FL=1
MNSSSPQIGFDRFIQLDWALLALRIRAGKGTRDELDEDWDPEDDRHLTVWECLQHLVRQHEKDGISEGTAVLLKKINTQAEAVKDLAYCLYDISANKRKDAKEATAYNALIADWAELTKSAAAIHDTRGDRQIRLDI